MINTKFTFWCQKVLPLVYDDSLSYYEVLCKSVDYINKLIDSDKAIIGDIGNIKEELRVLQEWVDNFDVSYAEKIIEDLLATMIFVELSDTGYIIYNIPEKWEDITFNTTGLDINVECENEFGKLVLSY